MKARRLAITRIAQAARRFPDIDFRGSAGIESPEIDPRDAALADAIEQHTLRRWLTLGAVVQHVLSRPWEQVEFRVQATLLCGAAQLLLMDRLPDYAVIDESVEWAKINIRPKAGAMVNAVLRRIAALRGADMRPVPGTASYAADQLPLHDGRVLALNESVFAPEPLPRLAQHTSHPIELIEHWIDAFGMDQTRRLALHGLVHAPLLVHGVSDAGIAHFDLSPHDQRGIFVIPPSVSLTALFQHDPGAIIQDVTSAAVVNDTVALLSPPRLVIDVCAGRGTKTRQLTRAYPQARIIATDVDTDRLESLREGLKDDDHVEVIGHDDLTEYVGQADLAVLDVPCSNSGVFARRVEAKYRFSLARLNSLVDLQRQIIADSLPLLCSRGAVLYSTCSVEPSENHLQAQWLCRWHPFDVVAQASREPAGLPGDDARAYRDGGYWALLRRRD